jgi:hypothetical protein
MIPPKILKIGEDFYDVQVVEKSRGDASCNVEEKLINIDRDILKTPLTNLLTSIFHEVNHGISDHFGFTFMINNKHHEKLAEDIIEASARGWVMLMIDNLEFFEEVISKLKKERERWQKSRKPRRKK